MISPSLIGLLFLALALIYAAVAFRDYLRGDGKLSIARKTWLRIAMIFLVVGLALQLVPLLLHR